ncbi:homogentisate 1,2-dioxygenase [Sphingomonas sp. CJ99]
MSGFTITVALLSVGWGNAVAQTTPHHPVCTGVAPPPAGLAGWTAAGAAAGAARPADQAQRLVLGERAEIALLPADEVSFAVPPERSFDPSTRGGMVIIQVEQAGRYRVALGSAAWVDVIGSGAAIASVSHGHGPACTGIRKIVDYDLAPGRYLLQLSGSASVSVAVLVARIEG